MVCLKTDLFPLAFDAAGVNFAVSDLNSEEFSSRVGPKVHFLNKYYVVVETDYSVWGPKTGPLKKNGSFGVMNKSAFT